MEQVPPQVACFAVRKTANDNADAYSESAVEAVNRDFYVDDLPTKSYENEDEAVETSKEMASMLMKGGFSLTKWMSNSKSVMAEFPQDQQATSFKNLDPKFEVLPSEKALGIQWSTEDDLFRFMVSKKTYPDNRKGVLASIAGMYDPLGFASPLVLLGKFLNQGLCKSKYG